MSSQPLPAPLFRRVCSRFATGIAVATAADANGAPHGLTVNSFTSVSAEPPLVLICIDHGATVLPVFRAAAYFGLNFLRDSQQELSDRFAFQAEGRFVDLPWQAATGGAPILNEMLAFMVCRVERHFEAGDHMVLIGEVVEASETEGSPLLYYSSRYHRIR